MLSTLLRKGAEDLNLNKEDEEIVMVAHFGEELCFLIEEAENRGVVDTGLN